MLVHVCRESFGVILCFLGLLFPHVDLVAMVCTIGGGVLFRVQTLDVLQCLFTKSFLSRAAFLPKVFFMEEKRLQKTSADVPMKKTPLFGARTALTALRRVSRTSDKGLGEEEACGPQISCKVSIF